MRSPELSIIVPVYKVEPYLRECIDSILCQAYTDYEVILVDDGSPDSCGEICDEYAQKHPDVIKVIHKPYDGVSSARNTGLDMAKGTFIGFVDSDDAILPDMFEVLIETIKRENVDVVFSQVLHWDGTKKTNSDMTEPIVCTGIEAIQRLFSWQESLSVWSKLFRRDVIDSHRFRHGLTNEDLPFNYEILVKNCRVFILPDGYYRYRVTPGSITNVLRPNFFDIFNNLEYIEQLLPEGNEDLRTRFYRYTLTMHIMSGVKIVQNHANVKYKDWLRKNRKYILKNMRTLIFDNKIIFRWKLKAIYSFFRLF